MGNTFGPNGLSIGSSRHVSHHRNSQNVLHERHEPNPLGDLRDAHLLAGESAVEIDFAALEADSPNG